MADVESVWAEVRSLLRRITKQEGPVLQQNETPILEPRRINFGHTYGPATGKPEPKPPRYLPGTLDTLAQHMGIASDDPYGLAGKLEAWKRATKDDLP